MAWGLGYKVVPGGGVFPVLPPAGDPANPAQDGPKNPAPNPAEVAQEAVSQLKLPKPVVRTNPDEDLTQVVRVPTWMWLERRVWKPVTATAKVPGLTVTATAEPQKVTWSMGDGHQVVCKGPGTPYSKKYSASAKSPDCGHVYEKTSIGQPGEAFKIQATIAWSVAWEGGGEAGTVPGMTTSATLAVKVSEAQAIVVR